MLVSVASVNNEPEAQMICARLADAGLAAVHKRSGGADLPQLGTSGGRTVYVEEADGAAARELLSVPEFTDEELAELSERAATDPTGAAS